MNLPPPWTSYGDAFTRPFEQTMKQMMALFPQQPPALFSAKAFEPGQALAGGEAWLNLFTSVAQMQLELLQRQADAGIKHYSDWIGLRLAPFGAGVGPGAGQAAPRAETSASRAAATPVQLAPVPARPAPQAVVEPAGDDDLTRINGIGPAIAKKLKGQGISRFAQLAALTDADVARLEAEIIRFSGRILREDWIGQAKALVAE